MNIKLRLSFQFSLAIALILLLFSAGIYLFSASHRRVEFASRLEKSAINSARLLIDVKEVDSKLLNIIDRNTVKALTREMVFIYDSRYNEMYRSADSDFPRIDSLTIYNVLSKGRMAFSMGELEGVGMLYHDGGKRFIVIALAYDEYGHNELQRLKYMLFVAMFIFLGLLFPLGLFLAGRALAPISKVVKEVEQISAQRLDRRVDTGNGKDEIARLAQTFNSMLERLEAAFEMQRSFVSNASHELRTPLTSITGQIEVTLLKERDKAEYEAILQSILEDIRSLNTLSNGLLELAQSSVDFTAIKVKPLRVDELLLVARQDVLRRNTAYSVDVRYFDLPDDSEVLLIMGSENLLRIAFINLIDNACKFSPNYRADVSIGFENGFVVIKISDSGIGIHPEEIEKVTIPFYRGKNTRSQTGHGIGLSLAKKIVELHRGNMQIVSLLNSGTTITIRLINS
ncbi:MAG TPA: HAMP domain-containing sensor histidine kinase [Tenuifilaceae bacterium]|nr:HAMP domain-containing sensor histidine kinase [Tenuifilaceae bacterium]